MVIVSILRKLFIWYYIHQVAKAKKNAYPKNVEITDTTCEVPLQDLLDHTATRLVEFLKISTDEPEKLTLVVKYGMDGTNVPEFKQKKSQADNIAYNSIFASSIVPLQLINSRSNEIYWDNPHPSSVSLCRPIEILYKKEDSALCKEKELSYKEQIENLKSTRVSGFEIDYRMHLTMVDGKVINKVLNIFSFGIHESINSRILSM